MSLYEHTIVARQDTTQSQLNSLKDKYTKIVEKNKGELVKTEEWGLLNLANKIKNYRKGFYIHFKFEGSKETLNEIDKKIRVDSSILRHLTVKYKKLDTKNEFFKKNTIKYEKKKQKNSKKRVKFFK